MFAFDTYLLTLLKQHHNHNHYFAYPILLLCHQNHWWWQFWSTIWVIFHLFLSRVLFVLFFPAFLSGTVVEHRSDNNKMSTVTVVDIAWPLIETKNQANSYLWGSIWIQLGAAIYNAQGKFEHQGWRWSTWETVLMMVLGWICSWVYSPALWLSVSWLYSWCVRPNTAMA